MPTKKSGAPAGTSPVQESFIKRLRQAIPSGIGMAETMAELLDVSIDSAYRRIRGETELTLNEIFTLSKKFGISVDELFGNQNNAVTFRYIKLTDSAKNFETYLHGLITHLREINKFDKRIIYYVAEEIPIFYSFYSKKLTEFKLFYWQRSVLNVPEYQQEQFRWGCVPANIVEVAHNSFKEYLNVPSSEIWNYETIFTGLRQIKFYFDSGIVKKEMALELLSDYRKMIEMIRDNAASGRKNISDKTETFRMYASEVLLGTNAIYIVAGESKYSYISFNTMNSLNTANTEFCEETEHWIKNLERKSTLISGVSEKQRYQFFSTLFHHIDHYESTIQNS